MPDLVLVVPKEMAKHGVMVNVNGLMGSAHLRVRYIPTYMYFNSYRKSNFVLEFV